MAQKKKGEHSKPSKNIQQEKKKPVAAIIKPSLTKHYPFLLGILIISFIAYIPALANSFVWDDEFYIETNRMIRAINLKELFSSYLMGNYHPLTVLSYAIEFHFFNLSPKPYHTLNIIIHLANTVLVFYAIYRLSNKPEVGLVAALLFGIHPMHIESVAWVSERKDLLYTFFFLAAYNCYLDYIKNKSKQLYFFCLAFFLLSLFSKAMAACFPVALLLTDYFKGRKMQIKVWLEKLPFFALAVTFGVVAIFAQKSHHAVADIAIFPFIPRVVFTCYGIILYIAKLIVPFNLCAYYPYPISPGESLPVIYYIFPVLFIALVGLIIYSFRFNKKVLFGMGFFAITIFLVLQILPVGDAIIVDRYSYIPSIGIFYILAEGFYFLWSNKIKRGNYKIVAIVILVVTSTALTIQTYARCSVWKDGMSLWNDVISKFQTLPAAYNNRGKLLLEQKRVEEALSDFNNAIRLEPRYPQALSNRGALLVDLGRYDEAMKDYNGAIEAQPQANTYNNRGMLFVKTGKLEEALKDYNNAIAMNPYVGEFYFNRAFLFEEMKKHEEALNDYTRSLELKPGLISAYNNMANILMSLNRNDEAAAMYDKAIQVDPNPVNAWLNKGTLLLNEKKYDESIYCYSKAIELDPASGQAFYNRGMAYSYQGKKDAGCRDFQKAISLKYEAGVTALNYYCH